MVACRHGISLLVFDSTSYWLDALTRELSSETLEEKFPCLRAPRYYSLFILPGAISTECRKVNIRLNATCVT